MILSENEESGIDNSDSGDDECDWIIADNDVDNVDLLKEYNVRYTSIPICTCTTVYMYM